MNPKAVTVFIYNTWLKFLFLTPWGYRPLSPFLKDIVSFFLPDFILFELDLGRMQSADYNVTVRHAAPTAVCRISSTLPIPILQLQRWRL